MAFPAWQPPSLTLSLVVPLLVGLARRPRASRQGLWALQFLAGLLFGNAVLRFPDGSFESRFPLHVDECGPRQSYTTCDGVGFGGHAVCSGRKACLLTLRQHLLEDADCNRVVCDNIHTSTPIEHYANQSDWVPFKNLCGNLKELFVRVFDLALELLDRHSVGEDERRLSDAWLVFTSSLQLWVLNPEVEGAPAYANTTLSVVRRHAELVREAFGEIVTRGSAASGTLDAEFLLDFAVALARRMQLLIENVSMTLLMNVFIAQLEYRGRITTGKNHLHELYGDVDSVKVIFHEVPGKRWDTLSLLLECLDVSKVAVSMAEVGVEAANTSQRLLERNPFLKYVGVDPYVNNSGVYEDVQRRLRPYEAEGRFVLRRETSLVAAAAVPDASLDIVFLDARHDFEAVYDDINAWRPKLRSPGGILAGHDFSWMFPTVAMAVYKATFQSPEKIVHLAPDGMWWLRL